MIKNIIKKNKIVFLIIFFIVPFLVSAATTNYNLLEPIAGGPTSISSGEGIEAYIQTIYNYLLGLAVALSVLMLVIGGVEYTTSFANAGAAENAKKRITDAITGLLIALLSFVILNTISPDLARLNLPNANAVCSLKNGDIATGESSGGANRENSTVTGNAIGSGATEDSYQLQLKGTGPTSDKYILQ